MTKKLNGYAKWVFVILAVITILLNTAGIIWNTATLHYGVKQNAALLQNDMVHLTADVADIKVDIKAINQYLLVRSEK